MNNLPIFEPLSRATQEQFAPAQLNDVDTLHVAYEPGRLTTPDRLRLKLLPRIKVDYETERQCPLKSKDRWAHAGETADGQTVLPPMIWQQVSYEARKWMASIPETYKRQGMTSDEALCGVTLYTCLMIRSSWNYDRIIFGDQMAKTVYESMLMRFYMQTARAKMQAEFKLNGTVPTLPPEYKKHPISPLSPYQEAALAFALGPDGACLFMEQGTGKTPIGINAACIIGDRKLATDKRAARVLVIGPKQVQQNWSREFHKFATTVGSVTKLKGGPFQRKTQILRSFARAGAKGHAFATVVTTYDTAANDADALAKIDWDLVICDESHRFKWHGTRRWKEGRKIFLKADKVICMTGTPTANTLMDIWTQLEAIYPGGSGFSTFKAFQTFYGQYETVGQTATGGAIEKLVGYNHLPLLQEVQTRLAFAISKKEAGLNLPDKQTGYVDVTMSKRQSEVYELIAEKLLAELEDSEVTVDHALTRLLRLQQICSGFIVDDEGQTVPVDTQNPKLAEFTEYILEQLQPGDNKIIVSCCFRRDITEVARALRDKGIGCVTFYGDTSDVDRIKAEDGYNCDPNIRVIIGHPGSMGEGLNLLGYDYRNEPVEGVSGEDKTYTSEVIFYSMSWSMIHWSQMQDRAHRRGMRYPVRITDIVVPNTIDAEIRSRVAGKVLSALTIQDVKDMLQSALEAKLEEAA